MQNFGTNIYKIFESMALTFGLHQDVNRQVPIQLYY